MPLSKRASRAILAEYRELWLEGLSAEPTGDQRVATTLQEIGVRMKEHRGKSDNVRISLAMSMLRAAGYLPTEQNFRAIGFYEIEDDESENDGKENTSD